LFNKVRRVNVQGFFSSLALEDIDASFIPKEIVSFISKAIPTPKRADMILSTILTYFDSIRNPEVRPFLPGIEYGRGNTVFSKSYGDFYTLSKRLCRKIDYSPNK